jgi:hypothetical protein
MKARGTVAYNEEAVAIRFLNMASKRSLSQRSSSKHSTRKQSWQQILLLLALVPLVVGLLLILTALTGAVVWGTSWEQAVIGGFYILFSFVASNALQKQWTLVIGWLLLGVAAWLGINWPEVVARIIAAPLAGLSVALISREFLRRRRQYLDSKTQ